MTGDHHDAELCQRLAKKVMRWDGRHELNHNGDDSYYTYCVNCGDREGGDGGIIEPKDAYDLSLAIPRGAKGCEDVPDYCCDPVASWLLEQKMAEMGYFYHNDTEDKQAMFWNRKDTPGNILITVWKDSGNRLHATALAAYIAKGGKLIRGKVAVNIMIDETQEIP